MVASYEKKELNYNNSTLFLSRRNILIRHICMQLTHCFALVADSNTVAAVSGFDEDTE